MRVELSDADGERKKAARSSNSSTAMNECGSFALTIVILAIQFHLLYELD